MPERVTQPRLSYKEGGQVGTRDPYRGHVLGFDDSHYGSSQEFFACLHR